MTDISPRKSGEFVSMGIPGPNIRSKDIQTCVLEYIRKYIHILMKQVTLILVV